MAAHRDVMNSLEAATKLLKKDIKEAAEMGAICTDQWSLTTEHTLDEPANMIISISKSCWATQEDSPKIKSLRPSVHDLYDQYKSVGAKK